MSKAEQVYGYADGKLNYLRSIKNQGAGKAYLAELRRGVGKAPGDLPELWGILFDRIPEELTGKADASYAEWAIYTALTLYALHSQGNEQEMQQKEISLGAAAARLVKQEEDTERILNRMHLVATAVTPADLAYHLRGIIQLLRSEGVPLDYAQLAKELYQFHYEASANAVKLNWGRDFYRNRRSAGKENQDGEE